MGAAYPHIFLQPRNGLNRETQIVAQLFRKLMTSVFSLTGVQLEYTAPQATHRSLVRQNKQILILKYEDNNMFFLL